MAMINGVIEEAAVVETHEEERDVSSRKLEEMAVLKE